MSTSRQESASTEVRCWGAELIWDQARAEMFRKICRDAFGRDCFCAQGGHCWLTESALDGLKSRDDLGHSEIVADVEAVNRARLLQILEHSEQLQEWQRAANRATQSNGDMTAAELPGGDDTLDVSRLEELHALLDEFHQAHRAAKPAAVAAWPPSK